MNVWFLNEVPNQLREEREGKNGDEIEVKYINFITEKLLFTI